MSALELCWHIASTETFFFTAVTTGAFAPYMNKPEDVKTPHDLAAWFDKQVASNVAKLKQMTGEQAAKMVESPFGPQPAIVFLNLSINHSRIIAVNSPPIFGRWARRFRRFTAQAAMMRKRRKLRNIKKRGTY